MSKQPKINQKIQYVFDNMMARGTQMMIGLLALFSVVIILVAAIIVSIGGRHFTLVGFEGMSFFEALWMSLIHTLDAGTIGGATGWGFRIVMLILPTLGGVFIISTLIGILSNAIQEKIQELRKGRSLVLEEDHTIILGWSPQIFTILTELIEANKSQKKATIAILADKDKVEMEDEIRTRLNGKSNTRVICRSGSPIDPMDLELVSPHSARSIIIIPPPESDPDYFVIKSVLAITNNPNRLSQPYNIITQLVDSKNMRIMDMLGNGDHMFALLSKDMIARITAQTSRQTGLSIVYTELLNFKGDEIYFKEENEMVGKTYAEALGAYAQSSVIGIFQLEQENAKLNPPMDTIIFPGDKLICISEDEDKILLSKSNPELIQANKIYTGTCPSCYKEEKVMILGWNKCGTLILRELNRYLKKNSTITIVADSTYKLEVENCDHYSNVNINFYAGDTTNRLLLEELSISDYDHVIILADYFLDIQEADARSLMTLLYIRDISQKDETPFSIVSEMLDLRNRELAAVTKVDDFIVSAHMISLMTAQLSENSHLMPVFLDILNEEGAEIYLKPVERYIELGEAVNFYTIVEAARLRNETAFGYRIASEHDSKERTFGVHINPDKQEEINFEAGDRIIVFAE